MAFIPAGEYQMGAHHGEQDYALPVHPVYIDPFYLDTCEVTNQEYAAALNWAWAQGGLINVSGGKVYRYGGTSIPYCDTTSYSSYSRITWNGNTFGVAAGKADHPMVMVSWHGAAAYSNWRSAMEGRTPSYDTSTWTCNFSSGGYRLPTEAEWEKGARGGLYSPYRRYPWGDTLISNIANYQSSGDPYETGSDPWTTPVAFYDGTLHYETDFGWPGSQTSYQTADGENGWGLYDMAGDVWEWCNDLWSWTYYSSSPYNNPQGPASGSDRVLRGGAWLFSSHYLCCGYRSNHLPVVRDYIYGFRLALDSDASCIDSNSFAIDAAGPGVLSGTVSDLLTGNPVQDASVTAGGQGPVLSGEAGDFSFAGLNAGEAQLQVSKTGYYPLAEVIEIREDSGTTANVLLTPQTSGFSVVEVRSRYCGPGKKTYYLNGPNLGETFTATINWDTYTPSKVHWRIVPGGSEHIDACGGTTATRTFNMGKDFGIEKTMEVVAEAADGTLSAPYAIDFKVIDKPPGILTSLLCAAPVINSLKYQSPKLSPEPTKVINGVEINMIPEGFPLFGKKALKFAGKFDVSTEVTGDGWAQGEAFEFYSNPDVGVWELGKTEVAGLSFGPEVSGRLVWHYNESVADWVAGGEISIGAHLIANVPPVPSYALIPPCPFPIYVRGRINFDVDGVFQVMDWTAPGEPIFDCTLQFDPLLYAEFCVGAGAADLAAIELYGGGGVKMILQYPDPDPLQELTLYAAGGMRFQIWIFVYEWPLLEWSWTLVGDKWVAEPLGEPVLRVQPRDYLERGDYALFVGDRKSGFASRDIVTIEEPIQLNVYKQSQPDLVALGDDLLMVWLYDGLERSPTNRTRIVYSRYDEGSETWSDFTSAVSDGTADFHPQLAALPNGDALMVWENVKEVMGEPADPQDGAEVGALMDGMKTMMEVAVARYDAATETWGTPHPLTSNEHLDRSPKVATADDGTAMAVWVSNPANDDFGSESEPNTICCATFDGSGWSRPLTVAEGLPSVVKSALAHDSAEGIFLFTGDTDGKTETPDDRELYAIRYVLDGRSEPQWGPVLRLTHDQVEDANPQVIYEGGEPLIVWYCGGDIVTATLGEMGAYGMGLNQVLVEKQVVVDLSGNSSGAADFKLATGPGGQIALVWQEASVDQLDMWTATYDPVVAIWSKPVRLTTDECMEYGMAPVFDANGDLFAAYDKAGTVYETRTVIVGGEEIVIDNVPVPDQVDLYVLRHIVSGDLAVGSGEVSINPPNPLAGQEATITAKVENLGDVPAIGLEVAFYDGDSGGSGTLIAAETLGETLSGGDEAEMSTSWIVPASTGSHDLYVVVDPDLEQEDHDRTNNTAVLGGTMKPDATVDSILVQEAGSARIFTIRLLNAGALDLDPVEVRLRLDSPTGTLLATLQVPNALAPGAFYDLSWVWTPESARGRDFTLYAIADEDNTIDEFDEDNNVRSVSVSTGS